MPSEAAGWQSNGNGTPEQHFISLLQPWLTLGHQGPHMPREKRPFLGMGLQHTREWGHMKNSAQQESLQLSKNLKLWDLANWKNTYSLFLSIFLFLFFSWIFEIWFYNEEAKRMLMLVGPVYCYLSKYCISWIFYTFVIISEWSQLKILSFRVQFWFKVKCMETNLFLPCLKTCIWG